MKKILTSFFFAGLLIGTGATLTDLKSMPQLVMILFGAFTFSLFIFKPESTFTILFFYLIIGAMLYINYFTLTNLLIDVIYPDRGWVEHEGQKYRVMDMSWVWSMAVGVILTPLTLVLYHRSKLRNPLFEKGVSVLFLAMTMLIYIVYEIGQ